MRAVGIRARIADLEEIARSSSVPNTRATEPPATRGTMRSATSAVPSAKLARSKSAKPQPLGVNGQFTPTLPWNVAVATRASSRRWANRTYSGSVFGAATRPACAGSAWMASTSSARRIEVPFIIRNLR
jgi:hypothetical protein